MRPRASAIARLGVIAVENERTPDERESPLHYGHPRMALEDRAKIFMPFDPLKGFREELRRREELVRARHQPPPDPFDD